MQAGTPVLAGRQPSSDISKVQRLFRYYTQDDGLFAKINWVNVDLADPLALEETLQGVSVVYHCSGFVSFSGREVDRLTKVNVIGTRNLVNACLHLGVKIFCHASSVSTINNSDAVNPLTENVYWKRSGRETDYAVSKYRAEQEVWRGAEEGLKVVIVNPGVILSPVFWNQSSSQLFSRAARGGLFYTKGVAGYVTAWDVAEIMVRLVSERKFGERYIAVSENFSYREMLTLLQKELGKRPPFINAGRALVRLGLLVDAVLNFIRGRQRKLSPQILRALFNQQIYSSEKLKIALDFQFQPVKSAVKNMAAHYLKEHGKTPTNR